MHINEALSYDLELHSKLDAQNEHCSNEIQSIYNVDNA
jgi:hypothetical protein